MNTDVQPLLVLRALSVLLSYPGSEIRDALPEIAQVVTDAPLLRQPDREAIRSLVGALLATDPMEAEERYVETFDHSRATSLHLFEHLHGEARDRGQAMVELRQVYERAGFDLSPRELPDYLPVILDYLSCRELPEVRDMLGDCADILRQIGEALARRSSPYVAVFQALLSIAGSAPMDATAASKQKTRTEDLDREWAEQPAFAERAGPRAASGYAPDGRVR
jgi:nitrate reductase delta subunit